MPVKPELLRRAARVVRLGGIIAYPTESVYGLGCDPLNPLAVRQLLGIKNRSEKKGLILISDCYERLRPFLQELSMKRLALVKQSWPGPVTWLIPAACDVPSWLRGQHKTLAVRVTAHPTAAALCRAAGTPLVSTSANLSHHPPARTPLEVRLRCGNQVDFILHGETGGLTRPTQIRDVLTERVVRS